MNKTIIAGSGHACSGLAVDSGHGPRFHNLISSALYRLSPSLHRG